MHNLIDECPICKSKQLVNIGGKNTVYGLVELSTDGTKFENPVNVKYFCRFLVKKIVGFW